MNGQWYQVGNEEEIPSPSLLIFRERVVRNIDRMLEIAGGPERLRPHVKTHKLAPLVKFQIERGITRFKCATIAEAEMTARAGASDVLLAMQPTGPNVTRLLELTKTFPKTGFSTIVDAEEPVALLGAAAAKARLEIPVLLDLDCGMCRTGISPGEEAERVYQLICKTPGLRAGGLHAYDGHITEPNLQTRTAQCEATFLAVDQFRDRILKLGLSMPRIVAGGTPTFPIHARHKDRELSPGTCVLWDFGYADKFPDQPFEPAGLLLTRVVSKPGSNRLCLDLGHKAVAAENPPPRVRFLELPEGAAVTHSEEHLVIETPLAQNFRIGQCLHGIPRHICPTVALHSEAWLIQDGAARETWTITARARRISI